MGAALWAVALALLPTLASPLARISPSRRGIVVITGFETFNSKLYDDAARRAAPAEVSVFTDRDLEPAAERRAELATALRGAKAVVSSLIFDFDAIEFLNREARDVPVRMSFESALELMGETRVGAFSMGGESKGPPPFVQDLLRKLGFKAEDKFATYLKFLAFAPELLRYVPGEAARDLRTWLVCYRLWNAGGPENVAKMLLFLDGTFKPAQGASGAPAADRRPLAALAAPPQSFPDTGLTHPLCPGHVFQSAHEYLTWYYFKSRSIAAAGGAAADGRVQGAFRPEPQVKPADARLARRRRYRTGERAFLESAWPMAPPNAPRVLLLLFRKHVLSEQPYIPGLIRGLERRGLQPVPYFISGVEAHTILRDRVTTAHEARGGGGGYPPTDPAAAHTPLERWLSAAALDGLPRVDAVVNTVGFSLVGGPAGANSASPDAPSAVRILSAKNVPYVVAAPASIQDLSSWEQDGLNGLQGVILGSLPELDGATDPLCLGGLVGDDLVLAPDRVDRLAGRIAAKVRARATPAPERRVAVLMYGFPPGVGATGTAALLNVPKSIEGVALALLGDGYDLGLEAVPEGLGEAVVEAVRRLNDPVLGADPEAALAGLRALGVRAEADGVCEAPASLRGRLRREAGDAERLVERLEAQWGDLDGYRGLGSMADGRVACRGVRLGGVFFGVQPLLGVEGDPMRLQFERDLTPHPQYLLFYDWLQEAGTDAVLHLGTHGTAEWLPGVPFGVTQDSWSDRLLGDLHHAYVYAANNPSESLLAKRRAFATLVTHNVPPYDTAGLYAGLKDLADELQDLLAGEGEGEGEEGAGSAGGGGGMGTPGTLDAAKVASVADAALDLGLLKDVPVPSCADSPPAAQREALLALPAAAQLSYLGALRSYLASLSNTLFSEGLHVFGAAPTAAQRAAYLAALRPHPPSGAETAALERVAALGGGDGGAERGALAAALGGEGALDGALELSRRLRESGAAEREGLLRALRGEYVAPVLGGDLLRDGPEVLPTGRNMHALDPYRIPSESAEARGVAVAEEILRQHRAANGGELPETVAVALWGLDSIKTKGESVGVVLGLVGARATRDASGRVVRFEPLPGAELGRPRVDALCNLSGIFRDAFPNVIDLLDDLFERLAALEEPAERNYVRRHAEEAAAKGIARPASRLFSNPSGDFGSMVNERVGSGDWADGDDLAATWESRNAFSYGRGEGGERRGELLGELLRTTERVVQEIDSVEYGISDIQEYYANTGAVKRAAEVAKRAAGGGGDVAVSIVEAYGRDEVVARDLEDALRAEYRTKLLNPKWAEAMAATGSGGAFEISQRFTAMIGWGGTAGFAEDWVYDQAFDRYVADDEMRETLRRSNPEAFRNVVRRMLEADGRGMWDADADKLDLLRELYADADDAMELAAAGAAAGAAAE